ncbi:ABC transporter permease [Arcanobacterium hippocoleae]
MKLFLQETRKLAALTRSDPKSLAAGIIAPTVILIIFALTFGNFAALKIAVVNNDTGPMGNELTSSVFTQTSPLTGKPYFEAVPTTLPEATQLYESGAINGILTIPSDFSDELSSHIPARIGYEFNNSNTDMAKNLRLYLDEGIYDFYTRHLPGMNLHINTEMKAPTQLDWFTIIAVGIFLLAFLMGAMFNFLYLFNKERQYATLTQYRLSPKPLLATFLARLTVALAAGLTTAAVNAALLWLLTSVNLADHALRLLPILFILGLAFISYAVLISMLVNKFSGAAMLAMISAVVIWFLSGATTSVTYASGALLNIALALPSSYGLAQIRAIIFNVDQSAGGLLNIEKGWLVMTAYALILTITAYGVYRRKLSAAS